MFRVPCRDCEPASLLLARLLRTLAEPAGPLFGDDVGADLLEEDPPPLSMDTDAVQVADKARASIQSELKSFLVNTLGTNRGVLAGLPEIPGLSSKPSERVLALGNKAVAGHAWWWLWWIQRTLFSRRDSYTYRTGETVYRVGGDATQSFDWFPGSATYGTDAGQLAAFLNFGLAVHVREIAPAPREPEFKAQVQQAAVQVFTQLEAATHSIAPAVFATMLLNDADDYGSRVDHRIMATAVAPEFAVEHEPKRIAAIVTVSQVHSFRLSDMLRAYSGMGPEENRQLAKQAIVQSVHDVCNKVDALATLRVLKLTMTAESVVFCPELKEAEDDEWEVVGHTFKATGFDPIAGKARLVDYDHRLCKRLSGQEGYDAKCAYLLMMTVFLASIRAQFPAAYAMIYEAVQTFGHWKEAIVVAPERVDSFRNMFQRTFVHARVERDPLPKDTLEATIDDFVTIVGNIDTSTAANMCTYCEKRPAYHGLLIWLLGTRSYTPTSASSDEDVAAERAQHRKDMSRVEVVVAARRARLLSRAVASR